MEAKFETAIKEQIYILPVRHEHKIRGISPAAKRCNILHQQALKEILLEIKSNLTLLLNVPTDIGYYNSMKHVITEIAKQNGIKP